MNIEITKLVKSSRIVAIILFLCYHICLDNANAKDNASQDVLPPSVREQLQKNADSLSAAHLEFTKAMGGAAVEKNSGGPEKYSTYFNFKRFYQKRSIDIINSKGNHEYEIHEDSFDRGIFYFGEPEIPVGDITAVLTKYAVDDSTDPHLTLKLIAIPYLEAAGFQLASRVADLAQFSFKSLVLRYLDESTATNIEKIGDSLQVTVTIPDPVIVDMKATDLNEFRKTLETGRSSRKFIDKEIETMKNLQKMEPLRKIVFMLDPKRAYGVIERKEWTPSGKLIVHCVSDGWKHHEKGKIWLPNHIVESYYTNPFELKTFADKPVQTITYELNDVEFESSYNVPFALDYKKPGAQINDRTVPEARKRPDHQVIYTVSADGATLREAAGKALLKIGGGRSHFWIWANVAALLVIVIVFLVRRVVKARAH